MSKYQTINSSAELDYPKVLPTLDLNFAQEKALDPRITFSRSSGGTYVGPDGLIKIAGVNQPRFEHDPLTGECLGFLYEETRTNLRTLSEDITTWGNTTTRATRAVNVGVAPNGTFTANALIETTDNVPWRWIEWGQSCTSGQAYTISCFVKSGTARYATLYFFPDNSVFNGLQTTFDLTTGQVSQTAANITLNIQKYPNDWYRVSATQTAAATSTGYFAVGFSYSANVQTARVGVPGMPIGYVWGFQLEAGFYATSYIPTTTSTVTRNGDSAFISGTNFSSWYNKNESSVFIESLNRWNQLPSGHNGAGFGFYTTGGFYGGGWSFSHGRDRHINPLNGYGTDWRSYHPVIVSDGGTFSFTANVYNATTFPIVTSSGTTFYKGLMTLNSSSYTISGDGYLVAGSHSVPLPNATGMSIGLDYNYSAYGALSGIIKRICYWPKNLSYSNIKFITK